MARIFQTAPNTVQFHDPVKRSRVFRKIRRHANAIHLINSPARGEHSAEMARIFQTVFQTAQESLWYKCNLPHRRPSS